jgi:nucleoside-diphosphate-sugar epimerase
MTRHALVLGAGGFLGSHLCRGLTASGWEVTGVVRSLREDYVTERLSPVREQMRIVVGDATSPALLTELVARADAVFPFAGRSGAATSMTIPVEDLDANGRGQLAVLEAVRHCRPDARVVFPGSRLQYGRSLSLPVTEDQPQEPTSVYGIHKMLGEHYHRLYARTYGLATTVLRISNPYGPHQDRPRASYGIVGTFLRRAAQGEAITVYGAGTQLRDYLYVDDLTTLFELAATHPAAVGEVFNASGRTATSLRQMAQTVVDVVGRGHVVEAEWPTTAAAVETGDYVGSFDKASRLLGWEPTTTLEDGLRRTWAQVSAEVVAQPRPDGALAETP